jgi:hypothetical protein
MELVRSSISIVSGLPSAFHGALLRQLRPGQSALREFPQFFSSIFLLDFYFGREDSPCIPGPARRGELDTI